MRRLALLQVILLAFTYIGYAARYSIQFNGLPKEPVRIEYVTYKDGDPFPGWSISPRTADLNSGNIGTIDVPHRCNVKIRAYVLTNPRYRSFDDNIFNADLEHSEHGRLGKTLVFYEEVDPAKLIGLGEMFTKLAQTPFISAMRSGDTKLNQQPYALGQYILYVDSNFSPYPAMMVSDSNINKESSNYSVFDHYVYTGKLDSGDIKTSPVTKVLLAVDLGANSSKTECYHLRIEMKDYRNERLKYYEPCKIFLDTSPTISYYRDLFYRFIDQYGRSRIKLYFITDRNVAGILNVKKENYSSLMDQGRVNMTYSTVINVGGGIQFYSNNSDLEQDSLNNFIISYEGFDLTPQLMINYDKAKFDGKMQSEKDYWQRKVKDYSDSVTTATTKIKQEFALLYRSNPGLFGSMDTSSLEQVKASCENLDTVKIIALMTDSTGKSLPDSIININRRAVMTNRYLALVRFDLAKLDIYNAEYRGACAQNGLLQAGMPPKNDPPLFKSTDKQVIPYLTNR